MHARSTPHKELFSPNELGYAQLYCGKKESSLLWSNETSASLTYVGVVNPYWHTFQHALDEEPHFSLAKGVPIQSADPTISLEARCRQSRPY